jgi:Flp pilus assembly protein TadG
MIPPPGQRSFFSDRRGGSAVEFAVVAPVFLLMFFGTEEFARARWTEEALSQTSITGARCMGLQLTSCATAGAYSAAATTAYIQTVAQKWGVTLAPANISLNANTSCGGVTGFSQVTLTLTFNTLAPALLASLSAGKGLSATACFPNGAL